MDRVRYFYHYWEFGKDTQEASTFIVVEFSETYIRALYFWNCLYVNIYRMSTTLKLFGFPKIDIGGLYFLGTNTQVVCTLYNIKVHDVLVYLLMCYVTIIFFVIYCISMSSFFSFYISALVYCIFLLDMSSNKSEE